MVKRAKNDNSTRKLMDEDPEDSAVLQLTLDDEEEGGAATTHAVGRNTTVVARSGGATKKTKSRPGKSKVSSAASKVSHPAVVDDTTDPLDDDEDTTAIEDTDLLADDDDSDPFADEQLAPKRTHTEDGDELIEEYGANPPIVADVYRRTDKHGNATKYIRTPTGSKEILELDTEPDTGVCVVPFEVAPLEITVDSTPEALRRDEALHYAAILSRLRAGWKYVASVDSLCKLALTTDKILESRYVALMNKRRGGSGNEGGGGLLTPFNH